jgi:predicted aspartyl protease
VAVICTVPAAFADIPGVTVVPFRFVGGFAVVVPVTVNGRGPYDFMLDTGSTISAVDRELTRQLALDEQAQGTVTTLAGNIPVLLALVSSMNVGPVAEKGVEVMVRDLSGLRHLDPAIRGVLGQNVLDHADFLLDYRHKLMEFDTDGELARSLGGHHVQLRREPLKGSRQFANLAVRARVIIDGVRAVDFLLDSGSASLVLFDQLADIGSGQSLVVDTAGSQRMAQLRHAQLLIDGKSREVPTQTVRFQGAERDIGGLLPTRVFSSVYISNSGDFAMFEPKQGKHSPFDRMIAGLAPQSHHGEDIR